MRASELLKDRWIQCEDIGLSVFEKAGQLFRSQSVDQSNKSRAARSDGFNRGIQKLHNGAIEHLRGMGFSQRQIDETLKGSQSKEQAPIMEAYRGHIDANLNNLTES